MPSIKNKNSAACHTAHILSNDIDVLKLVRSRLLLRKERRLVSIVDCLLQHASNKQNRT
jgi:hypothetical protein